MDQILLFFKTILIGFILSVLVSCGGGGGGGEEESDNSGSSDNSSDVPSQPDNDSDITYSGTLADGYLVGATVCLDVDGDGVCGLYEPQAITSDGGVYTFSADDDLDGALIAEITPTTIDEDTGTTVDASYRLAAPANYDFISPITTLVYNHVEKGESVNDAESLVVGKIGLGETFNPKLDYIDAQRQEGSDQSIYESAHQISKVIASTLADASEEIKNESPSASQSEINQLMSQELDIVFSALTEISDAFEGVIVQDDYVYQDDCVPGFELVGNPVITVKLGDSFPSMDGGVDIIDGFPYWSCDTSYRFTTGYVDTSKKGTKTVNYLITDAYGNQSSLTRKVIVTDPIIPDPIDPDPVIPDPVDPDPVIPDPIDPDPVIPDPVDPDPVIPDPIDPDPVTPDPSEPENPVNNDLIWDDGNWNEKDWIQ